MCARSVVSDCDPMDCSLPGSSVPGILQARTLERAAISSSRGSSRPGTEPASLASPALQAGSLPRNHLGNRAFKQFLNMQALLSKSFMLKEECKSHWFHLVCLRKMALDI